MLEDVKKALRLTDEDFDNEVLILIEAAKEDLISSGVASNYFETEKVENKLLKLAIMEKYRVSIKRKKYFRWIT